jgi:hypothetical protein
MLCDELDRACFALLYEIENYLRATVRWEVRGRRPKDWLGLLPPDLIASARSRASQEREIGYLDTRRSSIFSYLNLTELKDVILESSLWDTTFKFHWPPKEIVRTEFKKLLAIRNKCAHFRSVTQRDFRVAHRFAEDLSDWTRAYRRIRAASRMFKWDSAGADAYLTMEGLADLAQYWTDLAHSGEAERFAISVEAVDHHLGFSVMIPEGSASAELFLAFMENHETVVTFCRVNELADRLCCYVPRKHDPNLILQCVEDLRLIAARAGVGMSSDEVRARFGLAEWEGVVPWGFEIPASFKPQ